MDFEALQHWVIRRDGKKQQRKLNRSSYYNRRIVEWCPGKQLLKTLQGREWSTGSNATDTLKTEPVIRFGDMEVTDDKSGFSGMVEQECKSGICITYLSQDLLDAWYVNWLYWYFFHIWEGRFFVFPVPRIVPGTQCVLNAYFLNEWIT